MNIFFQTLIKSYQIAPKRTQQALLFIMFSLLTFITVAVTLYLPELIDWERTYRPATILLISGHSPYDIKSFLNPPWALIPLIPIAFLPSKIGGGILFAISLSAIIYVAVRMGATPISLIGFLISFPVLFLLLFGQIDWLILLGILMPPQIGLFFVLVKPQAGLAIAIFWLFEAFHKGGIRRVLIEFSPVVIMFGLSTIIYGFWFLNTPSELFTAKYNFSLWPLSIPIGAVLLINALRNRKKEISIMSSPFLSPYVAPHSWACALVAILPMQWEAVAASIGSWIMFYMGLLR
jgi:hypothetical protein